MALNFALMVDCLEHMHGSGAKQRRITPLLLRKCRSVARRLATLRHFLCKSISTVQGALPGCLAGLEVHVEWFDRN